MKTLKGALCGIFLVAGCANSNLADNEKVVAFVKAGGVDKAVTGASFIINPVGAAIDNAPEFITGLNNLNPALQNLSAMVIPEGDTSARSKIIDSTPYIGDFRRDLREIQGNIALAKIMTTKYPEIPGFRHETVQLGQKEYNVVAIWSPTKGSPDKVAIFSDLYESDINRAAKVDNADPAKMLHCLNAIKSGMRDDIRAEIKGADIQAHNQKLDGIYEKWLDRAAPAVPAKGKSQPQSLCPSPQ